MGDVVNLKDKKHTKKAEPEEDVDFQELFDDAVRRNEEKKEKLKKDRAEDNKGVLRSYNIQERNPLYISSKRGEGRPPPSLKGPAASEDYGDRVARIKASLEKINTLMNELKRMAKEEDR
ncbi:hypothetical protein OAF54_00260 [bacterium]|nr:hypothetical protein [bacterium]